MSIWVVIPAYNEADNLEVLLPRVADALGAIDEQGRVLVVDDGSRDLTRWVVPRAAEAWPAIELLSLTRNQGKASALQRGLEHALNHGAATVVMMDADGQDDPLELPRLIAALGKDGDLVTGARLQRRDRFIKRTTSRLYNRATGALSRAPGRDFNSGYKVMTAEVARELTPMLYGELHRYLTVIAYWLGYRVSEVTVTHHPRMHGSSKYGINRFWRGFIDLVTIRFLMSYEQRPSHLFGGIGFVSLAIGLVVLGYLTVEWLLGYAIGSRPLLIAGVLLVVAGLQLLLFGLLAELVVYGRHMDRRKRS